MVTKDVALVMLGMAADEEKHNTCTPEYNIIGFEKAWNLGTSSDSMAIS